jgi:flagellin
MHSQIKGLNQAVRNANDGISMLETADSATSTISSMLQRMRELAVQSSNGTYSTTDRANLNTEFKQLQNEIDRVSSVTTWNGSTLLAGNFSQPLQIGSGGSSNDRLQVSVGTLNTNGLSVNSLAITSATNSTAAISSIDAALTKLTTNRATLGAFVNRLQYTVDNLTNASTNMSASNSRIEDVDYGAATAALAHNQVIQQAATAMLAQANQSPNGVLSLLKQ